MGERCFICGGSEFSHVTPQYRHCGVCGHEVLVESETQAYIVNDALDSAAAKRPSFLERFQGAVLDRFLARSQCGQLVDIGSGAGRFLAQQSHKFHRACGIEITPASVNFAQNRLGLKIVDNIGVVNGDVDVATAWHSLEHFPKPALVALLDGLQKKVPAGGCVIVSVPNADSFQYRWFRRHFAFFDVPSHLHQFTSDSLARLFDAYGFTCTDTVTSWPYNIFGYVQALLNCAMPGHNYVYYRIKRGLPSASVMRDLAGICLLPFFGVLGCMLGLLDAVVPARQAVLTCRFERRR